MGRFGTVLTAMVTPFDDDGRSMSTAQRRWPATWPTTGATVWWWRARPARALSCPTQEIGRLWRAVAEAVTVPVVAGTGTNDTAHAIALTQAAAGAGVQGVLVVTPVLQPPLRRPDCRPTSGPWPAATDLPVCSTTSPSAPVGESAPSCSSSSAGPRWPTSSG